MQCRNAGRGSGKFPTPLTCSSHLTDTAGTVDCDYPPPPPQILHATILETHPENPGYTLKNYVSILLPFDLHSPRVGTGKEKRWAYCVTTPICGHAL